MLKVAIPELHVTSARDARDFYTTKLGFTCVSSWRPDETREDPCYLGFIRDGVRLNVTSFRDGTPGASLYIFVDDVDALHAEFLDRGVSMLGEVRHQEWGTREFGVTDADRNTIRFGQLVTVAPGGDAPDGSA